MSRRGGAWVLAGLLLATGAAACTLASDPTPGASVDPSGGDLDASTAATRFLARYVDADGRVVRRDEATDGSGDTVSRGQAYALLLAVQADEVATAQRIWSWTQDDLQRPDGLLSARWDGGVVVEEGSDAGADLLTAQALVLAGDRFDKPALRDQGTRLAGAVLDRETVSTPLGRILLGEGTGDSPAAASWPVDLGDDAPVAIATLEAAVPDPRWAELRAGTAAVLQNLSAAAPLPPDRALVHADGRVEAIASSEGTDVGFGPDAARLVVQAAASCDPADVAALAAMTPLLNRDPSQVRARYALDGTATDGSSDPVSLVAAAASATAAGDLASARQLLQATAAAQEQTPSFEGAAWTALGVGLLTPGPDDPFGSCAGT